MSQTKTTVDAVAQALIKNHREGEEALAARKGKNVGEQVKEIQAEKAKEASQPTGKTASALTQTAKATKVDTTQYASYGGWQNWGKCNHEEGTLVYSIPRPGRNNLNLHAGSYRGVGSQHLLIDLADNFVPSAQGVGVDVGLEKWAQSLSKPLLKIKWVDGSVPKFKRNEWVEFLRALIASPYDSVYACCHGGHGRTGTFFVVIGMILTDYGLPGVPRGENPVEWLRRVYCDEVVETLAQLDYIMEVTGFDTRKTGYGKRYSYVSPTPYTSKTQPEPAAAKAKKSAATVFGYQRGEFKLAGTSNEGGWDEYIEELVSDESSRHYMLYEEAIFLTGYPAMKELFEQYSWGKGKTNKMKNDTMLKYYLVETGQSDYLIIDDGAMYYMFWIEDENPK